MKSPDKKFVIPFIGLKPGVHDFEFEIDSTFFDAYPYSLVSSGDVKVTLSLEKKETMMIGDFVVSGVVKATCDRCDSPAEVKIKGEYKLIYRVSTEESEDENLVTLHADDYELHVKDSIYEFILLCLPIRILHKAGECDEEMVELLKKYSGARVSDSEDDDDFDEDDFDEDDFDLDDDSWLDEDDDFEDEDEDEEMDEE